MKKIYLHKYAFIGAGSMASAVFNSFVAHSVCLPSQIVINRKSNKYSSLKESGFDVSEHIDNSFFNAAFCVLAVKPYQVGELLRGINCAGTDFSKTVFVSFCAGVSSDYICACLGRDVPVIRIMPSTPITVGAGTAVISANSLVSKEQFEICCRDFSKIAVVSVIPEDKQNSMISVNGSSPAYVYKFIEAMADGAALQGIPYETSLPLILRTIEGACKMVRESSADIKTLIKNVCSPNGTTIEALKILDNYSFNKSVEEAMLACTKRADEISSDLE